MILNLHILIIQKIFYYKLNILWRELKAIEWMIKKNTTLKISKFEFLDKTELKLLRIRIKFYFEYFYIE